MVMNLYILFFISLPEAFLNLIIFLLFAGAKNKLKINKSNMVRFVISLVAMLVATNVIRPLAQTVVVSIILHSLTYILIVMLVYRLELGHAALSVVFAMLLFSTIENSYYPFIIAYISKGIENYLKHYQLIVVYAMPSRILQLAIILFLWKYEILLVARISKQFHKTFIISSFILIFVEYFFGYIFYSYFNILPLFQQIIYALALVLMVIAFNLLIFKTIYVTIGRIISNGFTQYKELEDNAKLAFDVLYNLLKNSKIGEAIKLIEELKGNNK